MVNIFFSLASNTVKGAVREIALACHGSFLGEWP